MSNCKLRWRLLMAAVAVSIAASAHAVDVRVSAAASLTDALSEVSRLYQKTHPDVAIKTSFAGSSTLAKHIVNGAPADIFISADRSWADYLDARGLLDSATRKNLLVNELVLIAPSDRNFSIRLEQTFDLGAAFKGKLCTGDPAHVPVGKYAQQALTYYGWWSAIQPRLVAAEDVRTALAFVERGECDLGIVYKTDLLLSKNVKLIESFPAHSHFPIVYPGGLTKNAAEEAKVFWQFLQSDEAANIFIRYGFAVALN